MTCINDLFDWVLEEIFTRLPRHNRLICKEVCKRWNKLLMERAIFQEDRRIVLNIDDIIFGTHKLLCALTNAKYPYQSFTIFDDAEDGNYYDVLRFFVHFGTSILDLNYMGENQPSTIDIFNTMPSLKCLTLSLNDKETLEMFAQIKRSNKNFAFHHLERLQFESLISLKSAMDNINKIKTYIPQNCSVIVSEVCYDIQMEPNELLFQLMDVIKIKKLSVDPNEISRLKKILECNYLNCDEFMLDYYHIDRNVAVANPYLFLQKLQKKHENLEKMGLEYWSLPPTPINLPKLNFLHIYSNSPLTTSLKPLEQLANLSELKFEFYKKVCGFGHEQLFMPKLKSFTLHTKSLCNECIEALIKSFENLTKIDISFEETFTWNKFKTLIDSWKTLETIEIKDRAATQHNQNVNLSFERNEQLREIKIEVNSNLKLEVIQRMSLSFPNLRRLEFETKTSLLVTPLSFFIEAAVLVFTKLKKLTFSYRVAEAQTRNIHFIDNEIKQIFHYLECIGFRIEDKENVPTLQELIRSYGVELTLHRKVMRARMIICRSA